ncbi:ABC transporter ATP-binding protein [Gammaproteobacteria bacterium]|jgi:putative ABC transport system ATP-binding protein|nr:ABC transporter ATP-binding protein [Candidatus Neomarinimicrobiota bacterium]MDC0185262.1 ABC transporter ATP-binding protein [Gammaproteobacteria bacterium]|tara:strand:- start:1375 stop:2049 length:675 start_codon:yes stop_codon:yes gene_type:complete
MIRIENLSRKFEVGNQIVRALDHIDLEITKGEYISIMGVSGSGKSTLLNILGLLDTPTKGDYILSGINTSEMNDDEMAHIRSTKIGFVFQSFHLIPRLTAAENIEMPMVLAGIKPKDRQEKVEIALSHVSLNDRSDHKPEQLSGGQRQRVAIARSIVMEPDVLLADEPTGNLDSTSGIEIVRLIEDLNKAGLTLIVVTHDRKLGNRSDRLIRLLDGKIINDNVK